MNEIHEFMGKFRHDVETKWGLATDSTLGDKVKITLLATGFGLQAINGMSSHQEEKKEKLSAEDKERKANRDELIDIYYERDNKTSKHRHNNIFIYSAENMDNDNIIARIDESPTYSRTKEDLNRLKNEAAG